MLAGAVIGRNSRRAWNEGRYDYNFRKSRPSGSEAVMARQRLCLDRRLVLASLAVIVTELLLAPAADARIKKIVIEKRVSPAFNGSSFGPAGQYETLAGRAYGELDPKDPH